MSNKIITPVEEFIDILPQEYKDLVTQGPYFENTGISKLGSFKEIVEEHPHCAGCGVALGIRLSAAALPAPADTVIVGTPGCSFFGLAQTAVNYATSAFGNQNAVASGLKRILKIRFPDRVKDVVVLVGDGGLADIGLDLTLHSWFRQEKITTIMVDNELYGNTGGQESGMSKQGQLLSMAPKGKSFPKIPIYEMAKISGCVYCVRVTVASPQKVARAVRSAIIIAREVGPTYVQVYTPCPTNMKFPPDKTIETARKAEQEYYSFEEYITDEAARYLEQYE
ncbi:thiamine pyrophosphate-dependent enzyme [Desulfitibacter alkalitolerans]|uniref:thiamine pyrophosphate-dependent enzyme n=1 Tax=Desulfitibacter alkalitolerans TaxID=264641 RepID=UPI000685FE41|nr:thiamine pyrophosphate-dependent enzyme [Desulfitibacter alkalitolerans]